MKIITIMLLGCASCLSAQDFTNLDFESEIDTLNWNIGGQAEFELDHLIVHQGKRALRLYGTYGSQTPGFLYQDIFQEQGELVRYRISCAIKTEDLRDGKAEIYAYTKNGMRFMRYRGMDDDPITGTTEWQRYSIEIEIQPMVTQFRVGVSMTGSGKAWFDDVRIELLDDQTCEPTDTVNAFMDESLDLLMKHSLYRESINRQTLKDQWISMSQCSEDLDEVGSDFGALLKTVDNHSFYYPTSSVTDWQTNDSSATEERPDYPLSEGRRIGDYGYIWMPLFNSGSEIEGRFFATHLQNLIDSLDATDIKGWVFDIRDNGGGNCWPMLAGIGPILGDGIAGYFQYGDDFSSWGYAMGRSESDGRAITSIDRLPYTLLNPNPPVAVLQGKGTGSSGEVMAISFKNRPRTRIFGDDSAGYSTGNENFTLSNGAMLFIASSVYTDRDKNPYPKFLPTEVKVIDDKSTEVDEILETAMNWLKKQ